MSAARRLAIPTYTREEFHELERTASLRHEYYNGHIVAMAGGSPRHGRIIAATTRVLDVALLDRGCFAVPNDQMVHVETDELDMDVYPDVVVYCEDAAFDARFSRSLIEPLVLIEVLSPSIQTTDLTTKLGAYFNIPTLTDYLIIWQDRVRLDQFVRSAHPDEVPLLKHHRTRNSRVHLETLNVEFTLGDLYRRLDDLPEDS